MTNDKLTGKLPRWALILQEYELKVIHWPGIIDYNTNTMSWRHFTTFKDFSKAKQNFDSIPVVHVSYVMPVCIASYMMAGYGHARHIF